jgi:hypothetical protein
VHSAWQSALGFGFAPSASAPSVRYAPDGYRVAIPSVLGLIRRFLTGGNPAAAYAALDFVCVLGSLLLYCEMLRRPGDRDRLTSAGRMLRVALFLALVQIPLAWVTPWQRPETTPTTLYLGAALLCLRLSRRSAAWLGGLCVLTAWQSFVRSDVPAVMGLAVLLVSVFSRRLEGVASRRLLAVCGFAMLAIALAAQAYLQLVAFPHLSYPPGTGVLQWRPNLQRHNLAVAGTVLLPVALGGVLLRAKTTALGMVDRIAVVAAGIYLVVWYMVGNTAEVRLYVPFLFALCWVVARALPGWVMGSQPDAGLLH